MSEEAASPDRPPANVCETETLLAPLRGHLRLLDEFLTAQTSEFEPAVRDLVAYTFNHRGKRLRPGLVFYAGWAGEDAPPAAALVRAAAIVELVHLATLVHDDILDDATLRHNSPTVAARHGAHSAVLLGDALFAQALILASEFPTTDVCRFVSAATRQVVSGEICQTFKRGDAQLSLDDYFRIIRLKTAELFECSCRLGALLGGASADPRYAPACAIFGRHLGIAYQIFDDIADFAGDEAGIGKTLGTDLASGKFTLPALLYLRHLPSAAADALAAALANHAISPAQLAAQMREANIHVECRRIFHDELNKAAAALAPFSALPAASRLNDLATYTRARLEALIPANP
jgi:octaprenyl-diphosphate synthase